MSCNADCLDQGEYDRGIFGCLDDPATCLWSTFCPCISIGQAIAKAEGGSFNYVSCAFCPLGAYRLRRNVAELHKHKSQSKDGSILAVMLCFPCSVCQDAHETKHQSKDKAKDETENMPPSPVETPVKN